MKKATLLALVGVAVILLVRLYWFIVNLSKFNSEYNYAMANLVSSIFQIAGYGLIGYFLWVLYKNQK